jgi:Carboxypeptidase regulatory-like domain
MTTLGDKEVWMTRWAWRLFPPVVATLILGLQACGGSPVRPSDGSAHSRPLPPPARLAGSVTDGYSRPVVQALVTVANGEGEIASAVTGAGGMYEMRFDPAKGAIKGEVTKDGFEPSPIVVTGSGFGVRDYEKNVRLYEIVRIRAGEAIEQTVKADDPLCQLTWSHVDEGPCRRVRVVSPTQGRLRITATVTGSESPYPDPFLFLQSPQPPFYVGDPFDVGAGSETIVEIIGPWETTTYRFHAALDTP